MTGLAAEQLRADEFHHVFDDPDSVRAWLNQALPSIYAFVFARCGANEPLAQDLTQETMVEVVRSRAAFDGRSDPLTWACGIARHKVADHFRRNYREDRRRLRLIDNTETVTESGEDATVTHEAVVETLRSLPEAQRIVLALHYLDSLSVHDIADRLGRSESAVESLLARGRDTFKRSWGRGEVDR